MDPFNETKKSISPFIFVFANKLTDNTEQNFQYDFKNHLGKEYHNNELIYRLDLKSNSHISETRCTRMPRETTDED